MARIKAEPGDTVEFLFPNGDKITVNARPTGVTVRGSGDRMGRLSIAPGGANVADVRVIG